MELEKKQTLVPSYKAVSETGVQAIHNYIRSELDRETYLYLPLSWSWVWLVTQGKYRGKLPNRLAHLVRTRYDIKLTPKQKSEIGNIARKHLLVEESYTVDFIDSFNWDAGDFGDRGSCFWGANSGAREVMETEGVIAIRVYDENNRGIGRAWLYELSGDAWVLFNAYGLECDKVAHVFAISQGENWSYQRLNYLTIDGYSGGLVYINSCPQIIYKEGYDPESGVDLDWSIPYYPCFSCGDWIHEDDIYHDEEDYESYCYTCHKARLTERDEERLAELEEPEEAEFRDIAGRAEIAHTMAQEAIRNNIIAQLHAGQLSLDPEYQVNLFYG